LSTNQFKKSLFYFVIGGIICCVAPWFLLGLEQHEPFKQVPLNRKLRIFIEKRLVKVDSLPITLRESSQEACGVIYVMGGSQRSLTYRFQTATELYRKGEGHKLVILHEPGITEYDPKVERNLTNDEWAIRQLGDFGVEKKDIEFISTPRRFLGTLAESDAISRLVLRRHYKRLILVSSPYHTRRVWITFSKALSKNNVVIHVYPSGDSANLRTLLIEYLKLISYKFILLPIYKRLSV